MNDKNFNKWKIYAAMLLSLVFLADATSAFANGSVGGAGTGHAVKLPSANDIKLAKAFEDNMVQEIVICPGEGKAIVYIKGKGQVTFAIAATQEAENALIADAVKYDVPWRNGKTEKESNNWFSPITKALLFIALPFFGIAGYYAWRSRKYKKGKHFCRGVEMSPAQISAAGGQSSTFAGYKNKPATPNDTTFANVAGCVEPKIELLEIVDILRHPKLKRKLGAIGIRHALLSGPPGTGKTMLAMAVANEAGVRFFRMSGSEFAEMFVGVGAARVRSLFADARRQPSVVFIDELDAVGRARGLGGGSNDEREATLNQLLIEIELCNDQNRMTTSTENYCPVIVLGATNRPEILDPALLRQGRFGDRKIYVDLPDLTDRQEIYGIHTKSKCLADDVSLLTLARLAIGFSGADIAGSTEEGVAMTVRRLRKTLIAAMHTELAADGVETPLGEEALQMFATAALEFVAESGIEHVDLVDKIISQIGQARDLSSTSTEGKRWYHRLQKWVFSKLTGYKNVQQSQVVSDIAKIAAFQMELGNHKVALANALGAIPPLLTNMEDMSEAIDRVRMGAARPTRAQNMSKKERKAVSVHEAGHGLLSNILMHKSSISKITILPRDRALGVAWSIPDHDKFGYNKNELMADMIQSMGGRAAEQVVLGCFSNGAQMDYKNAREIAFKMVANWGMSPVIGPDHIADDSNQFLGGSCKLSAGIGPEKANQAEREISRYLKAALAKAVEILTEHKEFLAHAAQRLHEQETMSGEEWHQLFVEKGVAENRVDIDFDEAPSV